MTRTACLTMAVLLPLALSNAGEDRPALGSSTNRLYLDITVGECSAMIEQALPDRVNKRLEPEVLAKHVPADALLTQRIRLPLSGHLSQTLACDEFKVTLDLSYHLWNRRTIAGGVSSSYSSGNGLPMQSHGNCFEARLDQPVYMGYVRTGATSYLVVGRFSLAAKTAPSQKDP
jgi:hypothetical protein